MVVLSVCDGAVAEPDDQALRARPPSRVLGRPRAARRSCPRGRHRRPCARQSLMPAWAPPVPDESADQRRVLVGSRRSPECTRQAGHPRSSRPGSRRRRPRCSWEAHRGWQRHRPWPELIVPPMLPVLSASMYRSTRSAPPAARVMVLWMVTDSPTSIVALNVAGSIDWAWAVDADTTAKAAAATPRNLRRIGVSGCFGGQDIRAGFARLSASYMPSMSI